MEQSQYVTSAVGFRKTTPASTRMYHLGHKSFMIQLNASKLVFMSWKMQDPAPVSSLGVVCPWAPLMPKEVSVRFHLVSGASLQSCKRISDSVLASESGNETAPTLEVR